jgi:spoIIIJ-associated protein
MQVRVRVTGVPEPAAPEPVEPQLVAAPAARGVSEPATQPAPMGEVIGERAAGMLAEMLRLMGLEATTKVMHEDGEEVVIDIRGPEMGLLIGKHGQTLAAVQHLLGLMANRGLEQRKRIILDAEGYRERREASLRHLALASARRARQTGEAVTLDPLLPHERRIIHTILAEDPNVTTRSIGEDPTRRIVVEPRGGGEGGPRPRGGRGARAAGPGRYGRREGPRGSGLGRGEGFRGVPGKAGETWKPEANKEEPEGSGERLADED